MEHWCSIRTVIEHPPPLHTLPKWNQADSCVYPTSDDSVRRVRKSAILWEKDQSSKQLQPCMKKPCACPSQKKGVVYEVLCKEDCSIWHTLGRQVEPWRRDYRTQVRCKEGRHREWHCSLCEHHPHAMNWEAATVLNEQQRWVTQRVKEAIHIKYRISRGQQWTWILD